MEFVLCWLLIHGYEILPWVWFIYKNPLKQTDFPFANWYQFQIASWWGVESHVHFPHSVMGSCLLWTCACLVCAASICEFVYVSVLLCLEILLAWSPPLSLPLFLHSLCLRPDTCLQLAWIIYQFGFQAALTSVYILDIFSPQNLQFNHIIKVARGLMIEWHKEMWGNLVG